MTPDQISPSVYPNADIARAADACEGRRGAVISEVWEDSPAYDAGFEPGCMITSVNGQPLRDIIDWRWLSDADSIELGYIDLDGDTGTVVLERDVEESWGLEFEGAVFDRIKLCRNACTFCFMHQLPQGMRASLSLRDDDFRLSFLAGTFVTFTNMSPEDEARIIEQHISPLRFSLQAVSASVRQDLMGKHAAHGIEVAERLLAAGIEMHAQIVLVPEVNDGVELQRTLEWAYAHAGLVQVGIVPLGYTRYQTRFTRSFNEPAQAQAVLDLIKPFQEKALVERGVPWVFAADEFYRNAYQERMLDMLPSASFYGDFEMFEDGVGIIRSYVDDWHEAEQSGLMQACEQALIDAHATATMLIGGAMMPFLGQLVVQGGIDHLRILEVENTYFGGNVDVTGLLTGSDLVRVLQRDSSTLTESTIYVVPNVVLNDNLVLLDDMTLSEVSERAGVALHAVSCTPTGFLTEIMALL